jgi:hypothetical protein
MFLIVNWVGRLSLSIGYAQLSPMLKADEAPALNFLFRTMAPVAYLIVVAAGLYAVGAERLVKDLWLVTVYYFGIRWLFNIAAGRAGLISWSSQALTSASAIAISFAAYDVIIQHRKNLVPNWGTVSNELWVIVLLFLYSATNRITVSSAGAARRTNKYVTRQYSMLHRRFDHIVRKIAPDDDFAALIYAVMIYESFNRPVLYRALERYMLFPFGLSRSFGVMQVQAAAPLSDEESVQLGATQLFTNYEKIAQKLERHAEDIFLDGDPWKIGTNAREFAEQKALERYNIRSDYASEVMSLKDLVISLYYPALLPRDPYAFLDEEEEGEEDDLVAGTGG